MSSEEKEILIDEITVPKILMRDEKEEEGLSELAWSIKRMGLINAITVRPKGGKYELVAGWRRLKAHGLIPKTHIRALVKDYTDDESFDIMAHENLFRQDVDPVDEAIFIAKILESGKFGEEELAKRFNHTVDWIKDRMAILTYPDYLIAYLKKRKIPLGVAKYLGAITDEVYRKMYVDQAAAFGTTVVQAEYLHRQWEMGLLAPSETIIPPPSTELGREAPKVKVQCKKCGKTAISPNIENVFIHKECPVQTEPSSSDQADKPGDNKSPAK